MTEEIKNLNQRLFTNLLNSSKIDTVIIPLGSIEQHGAHLPFSTDTIIVEYISKIIAQKKKYFFTPITLLWCFFRT